MIRNCFLLLSVLLFSGCASKESSTQNKPSQPPRVVKDWLTDSHARLRHAQVDNVVYRLSLDLTDAAYFSGENEITFDNRLTSDDLTFDFSGGEVEQVSVNGHEAKFGYNRFFITLDKSLLNVGKMTVKIRYKHKYSDNGSGLYRYEDSDGRSYLYTHFEPYEANKLFPHFDQPNIRANYEVTVKAPKSWQVITSVRESSIDKQSGGNVWHFPLSAKISSYIFPLHAGPYHVWQDQFEDIPLRLFARESLAKFVDSELWFDITKKGLAFYNDFFDYRYPFGKYDQLVVPDFNISGMENVAAVTYTERSIVRGKMTQVQKEGVAGLLLHEMSHMWFGDLITIDWWSNLWLKESFATYMSNLALEKTGLSDNAWHGFYGGAKQAAYYADAMETTHPIQMPVSDTKNGVASFDAITYRKGASVIKQLTHYLGEDVFRKGVRHYFKTHAWEAAKLPDFMGSLAAVTDKDLSQWTQDWLYRAGTDTVTPEFECKNGVISRFTLKQSAPKEHPYLRSHSLLIGLFALDGELRQIAAKPVQIRSKVTQVPELVGTACPDMVYPNLDDWGFVNIRLDDKSRGNVIAAIAKTADPMLRDMFYQSLWDRVTMGEMSLHRYIDTVSQQILSEKNPKILSLVFRRLDTARSWLERSDGLYADKTTMLDKLETLMWKGFERQSAGSDGQKMWFAEAVGASHSSAALGRLKGMLAGGNAAMTLEQDQRWNVLIQLARMGEREVPTLLAKEKMADASHKGVLAAIAVDAARPLSETKERWIAEFEKTEGRLSAQKQKIAMQWLFSNNQKALQKPFAARLLADLVKFDVDRDQKLVAAMVGDLMPDMCSDESSALLQKTIDSNPQLGLIAMKGLKRKLYDNRMCVAVASAH